MPSIGLFFHPMMHDYGLHVLCRKEKNAVIAACHFQDKKNHKFFLINFRYSEYRDEIDYDISDFYGCGCPDTRARDFEADYDQKVKREVFAIDTVSGKSDMYEHIGEGILKAIEKSIKTKERKRINYAAAVETVKERVAAVAATLAATAAATATESESDSDSDSDEDEDEDKPSLPATLWGIFKSVLGGI
jgi:hypothetical protein